MKKIKIYAIIISVLIITVMACIFIMKNNSSSKVENKIIETSINSNENNKNTDKSSEEFDIAFSVKSDFDLSINPSNLKELAKLSSNIVIIRVKEVLGAKNYNEKIQQYTSVMTDFSAEIIETVKGDNVKGSIIKISKLGGTIPYNEYVKGVEPESARKMEDGLNLNEEERAKKYVKYENGYDVQSGENYLAFLVKSDDENSYMVQGLEYGLKRINWNDRTVQEYGKAESISLDELLKSM